MMLAPHGRLPFRRRREIARSRTGTRQRGKSFEDFSQLRNNGRLRAGWRGAVTADHYRILGVAPGAEDAVIRAAYRALMRMYHPDTNSDPKAQSRVREITAAFAVLGDPERRAAYDAGQIFGPHGASVDGAWHMPDRRSPPPMRLAGLASIAVALAVTLAFALPRSQPEPQALRSLAAYRGITTSEPPVKALAAPEERSVESTVAAALSVAAPRPPSRCHHRGRSRSRRRRPSERSCRRRARSHRSSVADRRRPSRSPKAPPGSESRCCTKLSAMQRPARAGRAAGDRLPQAVARACRLSKAAAAAERAQPLGGVAQHVPFGRLRDRSLFEADPRYDDDHGRAHPQPLISRRRAAEPRASARRRYSRRRPVSRPLPRASAAVPRRARPCREARA